MSVPPKALGSMLKKYYLGTSGARTEELPASIVMALIQLRTLDDQSAEKAAKKVERRGRGSDL
jgi:hypothetical protein